jgi:LysM repeat protein
MTPPRHPEHIKVCPICGTSLLKTARRCMSCGYLFTPEEIAPAGPEASLHPKRPAPRVTLSLPALVLLILALLAMNTVAVISWQKRVVKSTDVASARVTASYIATTYISPTPQPTFTRTPAPPTPTDIPEIEYTVVSGDSCLSIARYFKVPLDSLLALNKDLDCSLVKIGMVLRIRPSTPTPVMAPTRAAETASPSP